MKNNLDYYSHKVQSHNHWKFEALRLFYQKTFGVDGWAGEGKFWALNNIIAAEEYCMLNITRESDNVTRDNSESSSDDKKITVATKLGFTIEEFDTFLTILIDRCKLLKIKENCLISEDTQEVLAGLQEKRSDARERQKKRRLKLEKERRNHQSREQKNVSRVTGSNVTGDRHTKESKVYNTIGIDKSIPSGVDKETGDSGAKESKQPGKEGDGAAPPPKPKNKSHVTKKETTCFTRMKTIYQNWYQGLEHRPPKFNGGEAAAIKSVEVYLTGIFKSEDRAAHEIEGLVINEFSQTLAALPDLHDNFLKKLRDIKVLSSKFNDIHSAINNQKNGRTNPHQQFTGHTNQRTNSKSAGAELLLARLKEDLNNDLTIR